MNIKNISKTELKTELPKIISKLKKDALYNLSIRKVPSMSKEPEWFKSYRIKQEKFNKQVIGRLDKVDQRLDKVDQRLENLETDVAAIKNCPTIKKELQAIN